jgi:hypothetical protein
MALEVERDIREEGRQGEKIVHDLLKGIPGVEFGQLDWLVKERGQWYSVEVKHQEMYEAPPFDGHGLPVHQVEFRMQLFRDTGIQPMFFVVDPRLDYVMWANLVMLEMLGDEMKFTTRRKGRRIYHWDAFFRWDERSRLAHLKAG